jgi:Zn-dependent protease
LPDINYNYLFIQFAVMIVSLTVHEAAHAWSADRLGDPTARLLGRVSLNPAVHVDPIGTIVFPLMAMISGAPLLGWAKPVPVNTMHLRGDWRRKFMIIAAAGPGSNLVLAALAAIVLHALPAGSGPVTITLLSMVVLNITLAVFNMIPLPPLDGGNVLSGLLRGSVSEAFDRVRPYGFLILYGLLLSGILSRVMTPPVQTLQLLLLPEWLRRVF